MLSLLLTIALATPLLASGAQLDAKIPDPVGVVERHDDAYDTDIEAGILEDDQGLELFEKVNGTPRRVPHVALVGKCDEMGCSGFYVFAEEPGWLQLREKGGIAVWLKRTPGRKYHSIESEYATLEQQAQRGVKIAKEIGGALEEVEVDTIFHPLPPRLVYSHGFIRKKPADKKKVLLKAYTDAGGGGTSLDFDLFGSDFIHHDVTWGRGQTAVSSVFVREVRDGWLKIQFKPHAPFDGRAMWVKHDPELMGELKEFKGDRLEQAYIDAKVDLPNYMETPSLKVTATKRVNGKLWLEIELWSHKMPERIDNDSEDPMKREPRLIRKGWTPYRLEDGRRSIETYEGC